MLICEVESAAIRHLISLVSWCSFVFSSVTTLFVEDSSILETSFKALDVLVIDSSPVQFDCDAVTSSQSKRFPSSHWRMDFLNVSFQFTSYDNVLWSKTKKKPMSYQRLLSSLGNMWMYRIREERACITTYSDLSLTQNTFYHHLFVEIWRLIAILAFE